MFRRIFLNFYLIFVFKSMKTDDELPIDHVGPIPGIEVGMSWKLRTMVIKILSLLTSEEDANMGNIK